MTLRNKLKNVKIHNVETMQLYFTRVSQIKEQFEVVDEEVENVEIVITTLMASQDHGIHSFKECVLEGSDYLQETLRRLNTRILTHNKRRENGSNWRSSSHDPKKIPQVMRNIKDSTLEETLIHLSIWMQNDDIMKEEDDEAKGSRNILPMKQIKISHFNCHFMILFYYAFVYIQLMYYAW